MVIRLQKKVPRGIGGKEEERIGRHRRGGVFDRKNYRTRSRGREEGKERHPDVDRGRGGRET